jgi:hypothetical protein
VPADPLNLDSTGDYSPAKFYIKATNSHDHSANCQTPFPRDVLAEVKRVSELVPEYKGSPQAFIRDAVVHRLHQLEDMGWEVNVELRAAHEVLCEQENLREFTATLRSIVDGAHKTFEELRDAGAVSQYVQALRLHEKLLETIDPSFRPALEKEVRHAKEQLKMMRGGVDG